MTEPEKKASGLTGFPTPNTADEVNTYLLFLFPDSVWAQYILGACRALVYDYNWYEAGDLQPEEASEQFRLIVQQAPYNLVPADVPAPYWDEDSGDDTAVEAPVNDQPWYGKLEGEDWVEYIAWWVVGAFLATLVTPTGAIAFITPVRHLRIEFKKQNWGGIVKILLDGDTYATVDTYSPVDAVEAVDIYSPGTNMLIVWDGSVNPDATPNSDGHFGVSVIRKRLSETDWGNPDYRYDATCDCIQYTPDSGATWVDAPGNDPRHAPQFLKPPVAGSNKQCDAAANMVKWLKDFIDEVTLIMDGGAVATAVINKLLEFIDLVFPGADLLTLIIAVAGAIFDIGATALTAAFTSDQYELLLCIFYCHEDANGTIFAPQFGGVQAEITSELNTTAALVVNLILSVQGEIGLSNAGAIGHETGDCSACVCTWCHEWNETELGEGDWTFPFDVQGGQSVYISSAAFGAHITKIAMTYTSSMDCVGSDGSAIWDHPGFGGTIIAEAIPTTTSPQTLTWTGDDDFTAGLSMGDVCQAGSVHITLLHIEGTGTIPAWLHGHSC